MIDGKNFFYSWLLLSVFLIVGSALLDYEIILIFGLVLGLLGILFIVCAYLRSTRKIPSSVKLSDFMRDKVVLFLIGWCVFTVISYVVLWLVGNGEEWAGNATYLPYDGMIVISFIVLLFVVKFYGTKSFEGKVWLFITAGFGLWMVSEVFYGLDILLYVLSGDEPTVLVDMADFLFLCGYIVMLLGFYYKMIYTKLYIDWSKISIITILTIAFGIIATYLVTLPMLESGDFSNTEKFYQISYVILDIILFNTSLVVALYWGSEVSKGWYILSAGLVCMMIADIGYSALSLRDIYFDGALIELAWVCAYLLMGLAGHYQKKLHASFM